MAFNPLKMMQFKNAFRDGFTQRHPKFPQFMAAVQQHGIQAGSIIEVQINTPDGKNFTTNLKVSEERHPGPPQSSGYVINFSQILYIFCTKIWKSAPIICIIYLRILFFIKKHNKNLIIR